MQSLNPKNLKRPDLQTSGHVLLQRVLQIPAKIIHRSRKVVHNIPKSKNPEQRALSTGHKLRGRC